MARLRLFEIHEQKWFPAGLRMGVTDLLQFILNFTGYYRDVAPLLRTALAELRTNRVVDLCSGGGGPWPGLLEAMNADEAVSLYLTDKFPNRGSFERTHSSTPKQVTFVNHPVDAEHVPRELRGFRTLFNSFHHFADGHAEAVLADAVKKQQGIAVFEVPRRRMPAIVAACLMAFGAFVFLPFVRPVRLSLFLWTYFVPVVPFVLWFDGVVSCLRSHSLAELGELVRVPSLCSYEWRYGSISSQYGRVPVTYLVGCPPK